MNTLTDATMRNPSDLDDTAAEHLPAVVDGSRAAPAGYDGGADATSSYDSSWDDDTPLPPRRSKTFTPITWALVGVLIGGGGFALGSRVGWNTATPTPVSAASRAGTNGAARTNGGSTTATTVAGTRAAGATGTGATVGQVQLVDGSNVYIQDNQGNVIKVTTGPSAVVTVTKPGTPAELKLGDNVAVQGTTDASGNIAATVVATAMAPAERRPARRRPHRPPLRTARPDCADPHLIAPTRHRRRAAAPDRYPGNRRHRIELRY